MLVREAGCIEDGWIGESKSLGPELHDRPLPSCAGRSGLVVDTVSPFETHPRRLWSGLRNTSKAVLLEVVVEKGDPLAVAIPSTVAQCEDHLDVLASRQARSAFPALLQDVGLVHGLVDVHLQHVDLVHVDLQHVELVHGLVEVDLHHVEAVLVHAEVGLPLEEVVRKLVVLELQGRLERLACLAVVVVHVEELEEARSIRRPT